MKFEMMIGRIFGNAWAFIAIQKLRIHEFMNPLVPLSLGCENMIASSSVPLPKKVEIAPFHSSLH